MQRKRMDSATAQSRDSSRTKRLKREKKPATFAFYPQDWMTVRTFDAKVSLLSSRKHAKPIIKKVLKIEINSANDPKPFEMRVLALLPKCNRIVHALTCVASDDPTFGVALFDYYHLGDLAVWKDREFDQRNHKPVPESYIWRFFVQMAQALAFIHNSIGPDTKGRHCILHRDIKPKNILVIDIGTTYPSFKLHDFGCASIWREDKENNRSYCGTFDWQPPENPMINTISAEVWALGACVHFLATGEKPIANTREYRAACLERAEQSPGLMEEYSSTSRYYAATVPRRVIPINLDAEAQFHHGITSPGAHIHQYSDDLNDWMMRCLQEAAVYRPTSVELMRGVGVAAQGLLKRMGGTAAMIDMEVTF